ncbi:MAG: nucleoside-diphosphate sugar epimerase/dehydratase [Erysipelotrichaceae bacterium]|nr:nucleoside-diphosphate sugar epimerase/dehydratase [Erysipelotrichaceae bacterium]
MRRDRSFKFEHWQIISLFLMIFDVLSIVFAYFFSLWLRFDFKFDSIEPNYIRIFNKTIILYAIFCVAIYWILNNYRSIWRFASYNELIRISFAVALCSIVHYEVISRLVFRMPKSYYVIGFLIQLILAIGIRFSYRIVLLLRRNKTEDSCSNIMIIGAGDAGQQIIRDVNSHASGNSKVVCIIDDNTNKHGRFIDGVPVVGGRDDILDAAKKYKVDEIYYAIPTATNTQKRDILNICRETDCAIKVLPGIQQIVNGDVSINTLKKVELEDLLGRDTIKVNNEEISGYLNDKVVLVTGGGGSIGSELCRQVAENSPKQLIVFDIYENNAYAIQNELKKNHPELNLVVLIGSVRDSKRLDNVFSKYRPDIVYHAAAHKHVPLMEDSPCESIKNNAIGTFKTAYAAVKYGTKRFVLISTDKAVNPTNIMGASKRLCEMVVQTFDKLVKNDTADKLSTVEDCFSVGGAKTLTNKTEFVAVRFGNVLGSNGSVIPLFKKQIEMGGPVTVTHPDIIRYFMTIPEAVSLVLQAGAYAKGGEIFIFDMGEPVKIDTLARNLIKLSGLKPDEDIEIEYTGLRPGEKLYEEKLMAAEGNLKTDNDLIYIAKPLDIDEDKFLQDIKELYEVACDNEDKIFDVVARVVTTYKREGA